MRFIERAADALCNGNQQDRGNGMRNAAREKGVSET